ncbi:thioredoxin-like domain-containing protein [Maribacter sp. CXY002]|uniref:thioredoxin-like domain-containing protein n=1 Tax=Maribacter luteocoastalis TaxID=3407671 RepID=UPI003B677C3C
MKLLHYIFMLTLAVGVNAQNSISGNFSPANSFKWLMVYRLDTNGAQYITDTAVKDGHFSLTLPSSVSPGIYRLVYAVPQDEYYIDLIYNCEEDIVLNFDLKSGLQLVSSVENKLFIEYFSDIDEAGDRLMDFYSTGESNVQKYMQLVNNLKQIQDKYESDSEGTIASHFVKANRHYLPQGFLPLNEYLIKKKNHFFDEINFKNTTLQASEFLADKILNYLFWAVPPGTTERKELVHEINKNADFLASKLQAVPEPLQVSIWSKAWKKANENKVYEVSDYIFNNYLKNLALKEGNENLISNIETKTRLRIGAVSPEITWEEDGMPKSLTGLDGASNYLIIFWSSTCSHCLNELPGLYEKLKNVKSLQVVAVGLEDNAENWKKTIPILAGFHHAIALEKWDSKYVKTFDIHQTPSYYILDNDKRIVARPENSEDVIDYLSAK